MATLVRVTSTFSLNSGSESAMTSFCALSPASPASDLDGYIGSSIDTLWAAIKDMYATETAWAETRLDTLNINGGAVLATQAGPIPSPNVGTSSSSQLPLQVTPVLSIVTPGVGPSFRGRMFMPPPTAIALDADGFFTTSKQQQLADAWFVFLDGIAAATTFELGVFSRTQGAFTAASSVKMGRVFDTQRSRRANLVEAYYTP